MKKKEKRIRRGRRTRAKIMSMDVARLTINRTPRHIYAQVISADGSTTVAAAGTVEKTLKSSLKNTGNRDAASAVGKAIAERALKAGISVVAFDRSGFRYHGRVAALAEAAREAGLKF